MVLGVFCSIRFWRLSSSSDDESLSILPLRPNKRQWRDSFLLFRFDSGGFGYGCERSREELN